MEVPNMTAYDTDANGKRTFWNGEKWVESQFQREPKIITSHDYPPIPDRSNDWSAHRDNLDYDYRDGAYVSIGGPTGHGATEQEAIADLLEQEQENLCFECGEDCHMHYCSYYGTATRHHCTCKSKYPQFCSRRCYAARDL
jgi:hypothetical protein